MDKWVAQNEFWNSFGIPAYDEQTYFDPDNTTPSFPHITYQSLNGVIDQTLAISANLWYKSSSWREIKRKADEILYAIRNGVVIKVDNGYFWIHLSDTPFAQTMDSGSTNENIKRIYISVVAESLTAY